jgi:biotin operon repressor
VLTLRYGLSDEDERPRGTSEIAKALGIARQTVDYIERDAKRRLRALVEGKGTIVEQDGEHRITGVYQGLSPAIYQKRTLKPEHEALFWQAVARLREQGCPISSRSLAQEAGGYYHLTLLFLKRYRDQFPPVSSRRRGGWTQEERTAHIAQVCSELEATGERISGERLAKAAHVHHKTARAFLRTRKGEQDAAQAR